LRPSKYAPAERAVNSGFFAGIKIALALTTVFFLVVQFPAPGYFSVDVGRPWDRRSFAAVFPSAFGVR